jgi:ABC-type branched-subunit amino acid transport system permease subunit
MLTDIMAYCIFALGYNIVLGYGGMMPFGHAGFYGAGAYFFCVGTHYGEDPVLGCFGFSSVVFKLPWRDYWFF